MPTDQTNRDRRSRASRGSGRLGAVIVCAVLAICSSIVAGVAWSHPTTAAASLPYTQSGRLSYSAPTSPSSVYGQAGLTTGRPVYGSVVSALAIAYTYRFEAAAPSVLRGTERLVARISNGEGITRTIPIQAAPAAFRGDSFTARGVLDMAALSSAAAAFDQVAGSQAGFGSYPVEISPVVAVHGRLGSAPFSASFSSPISFNFSGQTLVPGNSSAGQGKADFAPSSSGAVNLATGKPATLLFGVPVSAAREGSPGVLLAALLLLAVAGWPLVREINSDDERTRIDARYGSSIIEAAAVEAHGGLVVVEVGSFDGMLQVARRLECPILHWEDQGDVYAVVDSGTLYRCRPASSRSAETATSAPQNRLLFGGSSPTSRARSPHPAEREAAVLRVGR